jgi:hypothetical protein
LPSELHAKGLNYPYLNFIIVARHSFYLWDNLSAKYKVLD